MTFGAQVRDASGAVVWDSRTAGSGVVADVFVVPAGASMIKTYPDFAGRSAGVVVLSHLTTVTPTIDYALGYPRVSVSSDIDPQRILVAVF